MDDNIRFINDLTREPKKSIFDHPYLAMYKRLHEQFGLKVQLKLFYEIPEFDLSMVTGQNGGQFCTNAH